MQAMEFKFPPHPAPAMLAIPEIVERILSFGWYRSHIVENTEVSYEDRFRLGKPFSTDRDLYAVARTGSRLFQSLALRELWWCVDHKGPIRALQEMFDRKVRVTVVSIHAQAD